MKRLKIPSCKKEEFQKRIDELNLYAKRKNIPGGYEVKYGETRKEYFEAPGFRRYAIEVIDVYVEGFAPIINGWRLIACLEHTTAGNLIHNFEKDENLDVGEYSHREFYCEHCGLRRDRSTVYLLKNKEGEIKQVGSTCLVDFTGNLSAEDLAKFFLKSKDILEDESIEGYGGNPTHLGTNSFFAYVLQTIKDYGWISATQAKSMGVHSTSKMAYRAFCGNEKELRHPDSDTRRKAVEIIQEVKHYLEKKDSKNEYEHNIHILLTASDTIHVKKTGFISSIWTLYQRIEKTRKSGKKYYDGDKNKKIEVDVVFSKCTSFDSSYGYNQRMYIYTFEDEQHVFVWITSCDKSFPTDREIKISCKIKDFKDLNGIPQTIIKNLKLLK